MTSLSTPVAWRRYDVQAVLSAVLLPVFLCALGPWWSAHQFYELDEGINLEKAALVSERLPPL
jgi:hypothetical protein